MTYTLVEPCCGSAAFTLHMLGATRSLLPYQGSKWRFRHDLEECALALGFEGPPSRVVLTDPGPWGKAIGVVLDAEARQLLLGVLHEFSQHDPQHLYGRLNGNKASQDPILFAAEFLFLQRLAFSGKAVGVKNGVWSSPGFNKTSAYGVPASSTFGEVKPMLASLIRTLEGYDLHEVEIEEHQSLAQLPKALSGPTLVYLDPPYRASTRYPGGEMDREEVQVLAQGWAALGATVMLSEQEPVLMPGWLLARLHEGKAGSSPFQGKNEEWVTYRWRPRLNSAGALQL